MEDINNLLNSGEVPNMFPSDERVQILEAVRPDAARQGLETPFELWGFFVQQVCAYVCFGRLCFFYAFDERVQILRKRCAQMQSRPGYPL